ncbi:hypothetical protein WISP_24199 [Willisornis vidua]|uniref:ERIC1 protein n=1 Tax=Willisornis vidua TaxID=1566151 RepID=A0ABQ9DM89_9PASS|nr:hypothetical protein WISP_24199 [Willisornis vidua]
MGILWELQVGKGSTRRSDRSANGRWCGLTSEYHVVTRRRRNGFKVKEKLCPSQATHFDMNAPEEEEGSSPKCLWNVNSFVDENAVQQSVSACVPTQGSQTVYTMTHEDGDMDKILSVQKRLRIQALLNCFTDGIMLTSVCQGLLFNGDIKGSQQLFVEELLQSSDHLGGLSLDLLQWVHILPVLRTPELDTVLQVFYAKIMKHLQNDF